MKKPWTINEFNNNLNIGYVITDEKFNILHCNDSFDKFVSGKKSDILNKKITLYFQDIKPDRINELYPVKFIDNTMLYVVLDTLNLYGHELFILFFYDFSLDTELEKQIAHLSSQQYIYNEMFNKLEDGIYITDEDGATLYVNDAFVNLSGLKREEIIGRTVYELREANILPNSCCARVIETKGNVSTINNYYKGQRCLVSGSPIYDENGRMVRTIAVIRDVTELDMLMKSITKEDNLSKAGGISASDAAEARKEPVIVLNDSRMRGIYDKAKKIASVDSTVLILGETGVGKDFIASYIYSMSDRKNTGRFIKINCGAVPEHLLESEFFGYEEGAFTGAQKGGKKGLFEEAGGGILFLDEIGDMPYTLQVKLLNSLNDRMFYRIGGTRAVNFDARVIAATNADLKKLVEEKKFRADLYYRLNVVRFVIPPLRYRKEDIIPLAQQFLEYNNNKYGKNCYYSTSCLENFLIYEWPGNIREMKNVVERMVLMSDDVCLSSETFREQLIMGESSTFIPDNSLIIKDDKTLKEKLNAYEKELIEKSLMVSKNMKEASMSLGIDLSTLVRKKQKYGL